MKRLKSNTVSDYARRNCNKITKNIELAVRVPCQNKKYLLSLSLVKLNLSFDTYKAH